MKNEVSSKRPVGQPRGSAIQKGGSRTTGEPKLSSAEQAVITTIERQQYFSSGIRQMKMLSICLAGLLAATVVVTYKAVTTEKDPVYFAAYEDGSMVQLVALGEPNTTQAAVAQWLTEAIVDTFEFHFGNIQNRLNQAASRWFTTAGADELMNTWAASGNYQAIIDRKLFLQAAVTHTPLLLEHGYLHDNGIYTWRFQVPAILTFRTESSVFTNNVVFTVDVSRRSLREDPKGLGISRIFMRVNP